jgi:hypothetical protein
MLPKAERPKVLAQRRWAKEASDDGDLLLASLDWVNRKLGLPPMSADDRQTIMSLRKGE